LSFDESADVNLPALIAGFMQAHDRFELARHDRFNVLPAYFALFEALAWSYSIDERFDEDGQDQLREQNELRGLRYARNCVHHRWYQALWVDMGAEFPLVLGRSKPGATSEWRWKDELARKRDDDLQAYRDHLAGKPARLTLSALRDYLAPMVDGPLSGG
jgi:hypothetical protein